MLSFFAYAVIGMSAAAIAEFLSSPYALIVDVRMLNFFRYLGGHDSIRRPWASDFIDLRAELLVPLSVPVRRLAWAWSRWLSPARITPELKHVHRLRQVRQACPSALPVDKLDASRLGRVHWMPECVAVSGQQYTGCKLAHGFANAPRDSCVDYGCGNWDRFLWLGRLCQDHWPLEHRPLQQVYLYVVPSANEQHHPTVAGTSMDDASC